MNKEEWIEGAVAAIGVNRRRGRTHEMKFCVETAKRHVVEGESRLAGYFHARCGFAKSFYVWELQNEN